MIKFLNKKTSPNVAGPVGIEAFESTVTRTAALALTVIYCCHFHLRCEYLYFSLLGH